MACRGPEEVKEFSLVSDLHLVLISEKIDRWEGKFACRLGLKRQDITVIQYKKGYDYGAQKLQCLLEWKKLNGNEATYGSLLKASRDCGESDATSLITELLGRSGLVSPLCVRGGG